MDRFIRGFWPRQKRFDININTCKHSPPSPTNSAVASSTSLQTIASSNCTPQTPSMPCVQRLTFSGRSAKPSRIDAFMKLLYPFGILESSRSGMMALPRTPLDTLRADSDTDKDAEDIVDVTSLPPG
jgi:hypothetical protein